MNYALKLNVPPIPVVGAFQPGGIARAVGERAFDGIPVEARVIDVAHVAELAEDGRAGARLGGGNRGLAGNAAFDEVLFLKRALVELHRGVGQFEIGVERVETRLQAVVLLLRRIEAVVFADGRGDLLHLAERRVVQLLADLRVRLDATAEPDGDAATVDRDDALRAVEDRAPCAEGVVVDDRAVFKNEFHAELAAAAVQRIARIRLFGADDLHRAGLVQIKAPLGDVQMMRAPVAVVARAVVVVETPEHRIELVDAARRALVRIRRPRGGAEPHVPIDVRIRGGFRRDVLDLVFGAIPLREEAMRMGGAAEIRGEVRDIRVVLRGGVAVVAIDIFDLADETVADDHARRAEFTPRTLHRARLEDPLELLLGLHDENRLFDRIGQRLFAIDVLSGLHGRAGHVGMPVVRNRDADGVDVLVGDDVTEVRDGLALRQLRLLVFLPTPCAPGYRSR